MAGSIQFSHCGQMIGSFDHQRASTKKAKNLKDKK